MQGYSCAVAAFQRGTRTRETGQLWSCSSGRFTGCIASSNIYCVPGINPLLPRAAWPHSACSGRKTSRKVKFSIHWSVLSWCIL